MKMNFNKNKQGVSLIVLVITIIVMIILAATVIISLSSTNIFNQAEEAVNKTNIKEVQSAASLAWMEAYLDESIKTDLDYDTYVKKKLRDQGINPDNYYLKITKDGVTVKEDDLTTPMITVATETASIEPGEQIVYTVAFSDNEELGTINLTADKITLNGFTATITITGTGNVRTITLSNVQGTAGNKTITIAAGVATDTSGNVSTAVTSEAFALEEGISTLGELVTSAADYGKTVNYEANGVSKWQVFYEDKDNGYVFLIADQAISGVDYDSLTGTIDNSLFKIFTIGEEESYQFGHPSIVSKLIGGFGAYASTEYKDKNGKSYVVGAMGGPTLNLFLKAYNEVNGTEHAPVIKLDYSSNCEDIFGIGIVECAYRGDQGYFIDYVDNIYLAAYNLSAPFYSNNDYLIAAHDPRNTSFFGAIDNVYYVGSSGISGVEGSALNLGIRPVVCLKADIPAKSGTATDFTLDI